MPLNIDEIEYLKHKSRKGYPKNYMKNTLNLYWNTRLKCLWCSRIENKFTINRIEKRFYCLDCSIIYDINEGE